MRGGTRKSPYGHRRWRCPPRGATRQSPARGHFDSGCFVVALLNKKPLARRWHARRAQPSCGLGERSELRLEAKPGELSDQPPDFGLRRAAIEIVGAKIVMRHAVFQHVVDGREDEGGDSAYGLLPPAPALQPLELGHVLASCDVWPPRYICTTCSSGHRPPDRSCWIAESSEPHCARWSCKRNGDVRQPPMQRIDQLGDPRPGGQFRQPMRLRTPAIMALIICPPLTPTMS